MDHGVRGPDWELVQVASVGRGPPGPDLAEEVQEQGRQFIFLAALIVVMAAGVAVVAVAFDGARLGRPWADVVFWAGLMIIVLPTTLRLTGSVANRTERIWLILLLGLALYAVKVLLSPGGFSLHDELGQYRSVGDILRTGRLYVSNPIDPAYSSYPGIVALTAALSRLSGLGITACGFVVIAVARLLLVAGLFLLVERITGSARAAGIAVLIYIANPNFVFFDSEFAYESLALGIAAMALWMTARTAGQSAGTGTGTDLIVTVLLDAALVLTHHLTSYAVTVFIVIWAGQRLITDRRDPTTRRLLLLALCSLAMTGAYAIYAFHATESDIGSSVTSSLHGLVQVVSGAAVAKKPFTAAAGYSDPPLEQAAGLLSVALLLLALPFGLYVSWRKRRQDSAILLMGFVALVYPVSLALRLTAVGTESSNRTSEFLFIGLGTVLALAFLVLVGGRAGKRAWSIASVRVLATVFVGIVFVGGITVGAPSYDLLPAGYEVAADSRSIDAEGIAAARWASKWLAKPNYFLADETDSELFTALTELRPQNGSAAGTQVGELFVSPVFGPLERRIISVDKLRYLIVDQRDSTALPRAGHYFDGGDPKSYSTPIPVGSLTKLNGVVCINRVFASGHIVIYDTQRELEGCR